MKDGSDETNKNDTQKQCQCGESGMTVFIPTCPGDGCHHLRSNTWCANAANYMLRKV